MSQTRRYGWKPDLPDSNRRYVSPPETLLAAPPPKADVLDTLGPVLDQGELGSCTAHGIAGCVQHNRNQQKLPAMTPSRLMIYYLERELEGTVNSDSGAAISDGIQVLKRYGYCDESLWPYQVSRFRERPPQAAFEAAAPNAVFDSLSVRQTAQDLKAVIASKEPVVFGFTVFESFESDAVASGGVMPIPKRRERRLGGHCVIIVGYDDDRAAYLCRNSWGKGWGLQGNFWMPMAYMHSGYCSDFWVVRSVPGPAPDDDHDGPVPVPVPVPTPTPPPAPPATRKRRVIVELDCADIKSAEVVFAG